MTKKSSSSIPRQLVSYKNDDLLIHSHTVFSSDIFFENMNQMEQSSKRLSVITSSILAFLFQQMRQEFITSQMKWLLTNQKLTHSSDTSPHLFGLSTSSWLIILNMIEVWCSSNLTDTSQIWNLESMNGRQCFEQKKNAQWCQRLTLLV